MVMITLSLKCQVGLQSEWLKHPYCLKLLCPHPGQVCFRHCKLQSSLKSFSVSLDHHCPFPTQLAEPGFPCYKDSNKGKKV